MKHSKRTATDKRRFGHTVYNKLSVATPWLITHLCTSCHTHTRHHLTLFEGHIGAHLDRSRALLDLFVESPVGEIASHPLDFGDRCGHLVHW